jgi:hypothetical protein
MAKRDQQPIQEVEQLQASGAEAVQSKATAETPEADTPAAAPSPEILCAPEPEVVRAYWASGRMPEEAEKMRLQHQQYCLAIVAPDGSVTFGTEGDENPCCLEVIEITPLPADAAAHRFVCAKCFAQRKALLPTAA